MEQQARAEWGGVVGGSPSEPQVLNPTATDTDGDGIPDTWENANGLQFYNPKDALSDFDMDGLTALQEYQLSQSTSGQFGKPLGKWTAQLLPKPAGFSPVNPNVTLIECASNGILLAQVSGKLTGSSVTTTYPYIYAPATGTWTRIAAPDGFPSVNGLFGLDINSSGRVAGYFNVSKGFIWTPGLDGGRTEVFQLDTLDGLVSAIPKRIGDSGHVIGTVGNLDGRSFAARPDRTEIQFSGDWAEPVYHDVNEFGEFVGTVFNPVSLRQETFLACEGFPIFMTGLLATDFDNIYPWNEIPVIDPDSIDWGENETTGYQTGLAVDQRTGEVIWVATDIIGATVLRWANGYVPGDEYPCYVHSFPGFSHLIGAVNDWGEFTGTFIGSMSGIEFDENRYELNYYDESASGLFFFDGSFHGTDQSSLIYGVSNDSQVLIGTPYAVWSGSSLVPVSKLLPAGVSSNITRARIADRGQLILQIGTSMYYLKPNQDADGDSMPDDWEKYYGFDPNNASDATGDADQDGISNYAEFKFRTNPQLLPVPGSPGQFIDIRPGIDTDGDGLPNVVEWKYGLNYNNASDASTDADHDGLSNLQEFRLGTKISGVDSDGDGVSDWDEIMVNFTNPLSATDNDHDGIAEDFEKHLAKQLLEFQPDPLVWGIFYAGIMTGDLDANHDYTGEGRTLSEYAVLRLEPWSSTTAETESRMTATLYGETGIIQTTSGGVTETRAFGSFAHGWYNGAPSTDMTTTLVPNAAWYISKTELLSWDARYMTAFNPNSPSSSIRLSHNIQITTDRNTTKTLYPGRYEQKRIRIWGPKIANAPVTYHYLIITQRTNKSFDAYPSTTISAVPVKLEIKKGQSSSDWLEIKPTLDSSQDHSYVVSLLPVEVTVAFGLGAEPVGPKNSRELLETYLETIKVSRTGDTWFVKYTDAQGVEKFYGIEIVTTKEKLIDALKRAGQKVVFDGHSNFGLGPNFSGKVTHKTIADFTHFGVGKTSIPKSFRGDGTETDVIPYTNGDGTTLPTNPQDLAAIDRVHSEGWAYLKLESGQIIGAPQNYQIEDLGIERFKNLQGVAPGSTFTKQGNGFNNEWHFDNQEASRRLIVQAPSTDVPTLGYAKFFYNACNTGRDYVESFKHGDFIYTKESCKVEDATKIFVQGIVEGKSNEKIMTNLNQNGVGNAGNQSPQIYGFKTF